MVDVKNFSATNSPLALLVLGAMVGQSILAQGDWREVTMTGGAYVINQTPSSNASDRVTTPRVGTEAAVSDEELAQAAQVFFNRLSESQEITEREVSKAIYSSIWDLYQE